MAAAGPEGPFGVLDGSNPQRLEVRRKIKAFAAVATPAAAKELVIRFFAHLARVLSSPPGQASPPSSARGRWKVLFSVRGVARPGDSARASWAVDYWQNSGEGPPLGEVRELPGESSNEADATATIEVSCYKDILDVVGERTSPLMAIARRRLVYSGDLMAAMRKLRPAISETMQAVVLDLPGLQAKAPTEGISNTWMPDEASPSCLICQGPWGLLRRRHHCRACGILVCKNCSSLRPDGVRRCSLCLSNQPPRVWANAATPAGAVPLGNASLASAESVATSAAMSVAMSPRPAHQEPARLPPGIEESGLLLAQLSEGLAQHLVAPISAAPPDSFQQRLFQRVTAVEKAAKAKKAELTASGLLQRGVLRLVMGLLRLQLCAAACFLVLAPADELPGAVQGFAARKAESWPRIMPRLAILLLVGILAFAARRPASLGAAAAAVLALRWQALGPAPVAYTLCATLPVWSAFCIALAVAVLVALRLVGRLLAIYLIAAVPISVYVACRQAQRLLRLSDETTQEWLYDSADALMAPFLTGRFLALGGLFVKLGQWLANAAYGVPIAVQEQLKRLTDDAPSDSERHIRKILEQEFGKSMEDLFESFDFKPLASASIGQVHTAVLKGGKQKVAVKLQHEDVEPTMLADLRALRRIVAFAAWLGGEKWQSTLKMLDAWSGDMVYELDFAHEAKNLREVREGLVAAGVEVVVPKELEGWISKRAFVMEFCEGFRFTDRDLLALHGVDRDALGARALHATASQLLEIGLFNSDPHSGNLLCQVKETSALPVLLDFGNCIRLPDKQRLAYCKLLVALSEMSVTKSREALDQIGLITTQSSTHPERDLEFMLMMFRDTGSREQQGKDKDEFFALRRQQRQEDFKAMGANTKKEQKAAKKQVQRYPTQVPDEFILFVRMMYLVRGLCTQLDATLPFIQIFEQHARKALAMQQPSPARARALLPPEETSGLPRNAAELRQKLRAALAQVCSERPGLGVQVCVYVGKNRTADECAGVLGAVDPRPMARNTPLPLADLSRLPLLLALQAEARAGRLSYSEPLAPLLGGDAGSSCSLQLRHALAQRALLPPGEESRAALTRTSGQDLRKASTLQGRLLQALAPSPSESAHYLPLGAGCAAAAALKASSGLSPQTALRRLPGFQEAEMAFGAPAGAPPAASLSSTILAEMRTALSGGKAGGAFLGALSAAGAEGGSQAQAAPAADVSPPDGSAPEPQPAAAPPAGPKSLAGSILDVAGGLLIDPALASSAVAGATPGEASPDLACAASARALASVLAAAEPALEALPPLGRESAPRGMAAMLAGLAPPRCWDERGLELFFPEGASAAAAVGLKSAGGLLGAAVQWRSGGSSRAPVTVVVLSNEMSFGALPSRLIGEVVEALGLSPLVGLQG